jgi:hypothetical protein
MFSREAALLAVRNGGVWCRISRARNGAKRSESACLFRRRAGVKIMWCAVRMSPVVLWDLSP